MGFALPKLKYSVHLPARYYLLIALLIILTHFLFSRLHEEYGEATSLSQLAPGWTKSPSVVAHCDSVEEESTWGTLEGDQYPRAAHRPQTGESQNTTEGPQLIKYQGKLTPHL